MTAKKQQNTHRDLSALAALRTSMNNEGSTVTIEKTAEEAKPVEEPVTTTETTSEMSREEKAKARAKREAERKRQKRLAEKGELVVAAAREEMERTGADVVQLNPKAKAEEPVGDDDVDAAIDAHVAEQIASEVPSWAGSMVGNYRTELKLPDTVSDREIFDVLETTKGMNTEDVTITLRNHFDLPIEAIEEPVKEATLVPVEAPKTPREKERLAKDQAIARIVAYFPEKHREEESGMLHDFELRHLNEIGEKLARHLGPSDGHANELHKVYMERMRDPEVIAALKAMDVLGGEYDKMISRLSKVIGNDVLSNALMSNEFRTASRDAVNALAVLKKLIIGDLEPVLRRYLNPKASTKKNDTSLPEGLSQLMAILRHAAAHLDAATARNRASESQKDELINRIAQKDRELEAITGKLSDAIRRHAEQFVAIPNMDVYVYCRSNKKFLANAMLPTGRNPDNKMVSITKFFWTDNPSEALRFIDRVKAMSTVDKIMEASTRWKSAVEPNVAGEKINNVGIADAVIRLPTE